MFSKQSVTNIKLFCHLSGLQSVLCGHICRHFSAKKKVQLKTDNDESSAITKNILCKNVAEFLKAPEYNVMRDIIPPKLLKKYKDPSLLYLFDNKTAEVIVDTIGDNVTKDDLLLEINPGFGILTEKLLQTYQNNIYLYDSQIIFKSSIMKLQERYPGRIQYTNADFYGMWKLAYRDKMDGGTRMADLLGELAVLNQEKTIKVLGAMPGLNFVKHLTYSTIFQSDVNLLRNPELYIVMQGSHLAYLNESSLKDSGSPKRLMPVMFKLLFDMEVLGKVPRAHFVPWSHHSKKHSIEDENTMYIVKIVSKKELPCQLDHLPLLWYFFKTNVSSNKKRIIPSLERWVPGAGVWLITGQSPPDVNQELAPGPHETLPHLNIFTQYKDLTLKQKVTVFKRFISLPEFEECPFRATVEQNLPRSIAVVNEKEIPIRQGGADETDLTDIDSDEEKSDEEEEEDKEYTA